MMHRKLFIHIGAHKTGTTYIQNCCANNYDLLKQQGLLYPMTGRNSMVGHAHLITSLKSDKLTKKIKKEFKKEGSLFDGDVLISSENFEHLNDNEIRRLLSIFSDRKIVVIFFFRKWGAILHSNWQEEIKHGACYQYFDYANRHLSFPFLSPLLNFSIVVDRFRKVVGEDSLILLSYDFIVRNQNLLTEFFNAIDYIAPPIDSSQNINSRFSPNDVETIRALNNLYWQQDINPWQRVTLRKIKKIIEEEGNKAQQILEHAMELNRIKILDVSKSLDSQRVITRFLEEYSDQIIGNTSEILEEIISTKEPRVVIDPNYLFEPQSLDYLRWLASSLDTKYRIKS